jgi:hypothetical protein
VGVYASTSSPNFGQDQSSFYGNNWIHDNTGFEAQQSGAGYQLHARRGYWSGQESNTSGAVNKTPVLGSAPSPVGWGRSMSYDPTLRIGTPPAIIATLIPEDIQYTMAASTIMAKTAATNSATTNWTADLQAAIAQGLATGEWSEAGEVVGALHRELQNARIPEVDFTLVNSYVNDATVAAFIRKMLVLVLMEKELAANDISAALIKLTALAMSAPENAAELLANAGVIHLYRRNDLPSAQNVLAQLQVMAKNGDTVAAELVEAFNVILPRYQRQQTIISQRGGLEKPLVASLETPALNKVSSLAQNYPNPFNPATSIHFYLGERQKVRLVIYDLAGHRVRTLVEGELAAGEQTISWDGRENGNERGLFLRAGHRQSS